MRRHIYTGAMGATYFSLMGGILFNYFGKSIGVSDFQWGLMGGISSFLLASQLLSAHLTQRVGRRKFLWFVTALAGRVVRTLGVVVALWFWYAGYAQAAIILIAMICLSNLFDAMAGPPWLSWLADIIPRDVHGGFWGRRTAWVALAVICAALSAGLLMDWVPQTTKLQAVTGIFLFAGFIGIVDILIHGTIPEPAMELSARNHFLHDVLAPLRDRGFRPWLVFNVCWTFSMTLGGSLANLYFLTGLNLRQHLLGGMVVLTVFQLVGGMLTSGWSGRLVDRVGIKRVMGWGHTFWSILPLFWILASPATALLWLAVSSMVGGVSCTAASNATNKLITRYRPPAETAMYVAVSACLGSLAAGVGAITAGTVLRVFETWHQNVGSWTFVNFHILFVSSLCLRLLTTALLLPRINNLEAAPRPSEA